MPLPEICEFVSYLNVKKSNVLVIIVNVLKRLMKYETLHSVSSLKK